MKRKILITKQNDKITINDYFDTSVRLPMPDFTRLGTYVTYHLVLTDVTESHCLWTWAGLPVLSTRNHRKNSYSAPLLLLDWKYLYFLIHNNDSVQININSSWAWVNTCMTQDRGGICVLNHCHCHFWILWCGILKFPCK